MARNEGQEQASLLRQQAAEAVPPAEQRGWWAFLCPLRCIVSLPLYD